MPQRNGYGWFSDECEIIHSGGSFLLRSGAPGWERRAGIFCSQAYSGIAYDVVFRVVLARKLRN